MIVFLSGGMNLSVVSVVLCSSGSGFVLIVNRCVSVLVVLIVKCWLSVWCVLKVVSVVVLKFCVDSVLMSVCVLCRLRLSFWFVIGCSVCVVLLMIVMWLLMSVCVVFRLSGNDVCLVIVMNLFMCLLNMLLSLCRNVLLGSVVCCVVLLGV